MANAFKEKITKSIPAKYLSLIFSLLGGSALVLFWIALGGQSKQLGAAAPAGPPPDNGSVPTPDSAAAGIYKDGVYKASSDAPWGPMTVEVTVSGGKWTSITTPAIPDSPPSYYAVTYLVERALAAQSDQIDGVSGATYTSDAFRDDLRQIIQLSKK